MPLPPPFANPSAADDTAMHALLFANRDSGASPQLSYATPALLQFFRRSSSASGPLALLRRYAPRRYAAEQLLQRRRRDLSFTDRRSISGSQPLAPRYERNLIKEKEEIVQEIATADQVFGAGDDEGGGRIATADQASNNMTSTGPSGPSQPHGRLKRKLKSKKV
ncbi:hypothetical protein LXL04_032902 [Taraxacum kok-saghyz]